MAPWTLAVGRNDHGQFGIGRIDADKEVNDCIVIPKLYNKPLAQVAAGRNHTLVLDSEFTFDSSQDYSLKPFFSLLFLGVICFLHCLFFCECSAFGHVFCFGSGQNGLLGLSDDDDDVLEPELIHPKTLGSVRMIASGEDHCCALNGKILSTLLYTTHLPSEQVFTFYSACCGLLTFHCFYVIFPLILCSFQSCWRF
jgi:hypothetical protein